jgi:Trk K+ transport system NAD-binding subunit
MGGEVAETMRLADTEVPVARLPLAHGSEVAGASVAEVEQRFGCAVLAEAPAGGDWRPVADPNRRLAVGEEIAVAGPLLEVLKAAEIAGADIRTREPARRSRRRSKGFRRRLPRALIISGALLIGVLFAMVAVFAIVLHTGPIHAFYDAVLTAFGNGPVDPTSPEHGGLKVFAILCMIACGVLVGAVFSFATAAVTEERLERRDARRIARLHGHAIVVGLDDVGYRLEQVLHRMHVPTVALDREADARFSSALAARTPLVLGDPRIPENLQRAGIEEAGLLFAVTRDELLNVEVCLQARAQNKNLRTVARVFDDDFAEDASRTLGIDATLSASGAAATAFASAATDERAVRPFRLGELEMAARRLDLTRSLARSEIETWAQTGLRVAAFRHHPHGVRPPTELPDVLEPGDRLIVVGPLEAVRGAAS